jgi:protein-disulfide isomerase
MSDDRLTRRGVVGAALALGATGARAAAFAPEPDDMAMGNPRASVVVVEYASAGCPHCAHWASEVFPAFKAKFVDTGKVRFVMREMDFGDADVAAAGFMLARCAGPAKYFDVVDAVFRGQASMYEPGGSPEAVLSGIAHQFGLTDAALQACLDNQASINAFNARADRHHAADHVDATPTFEVNGKRLEGPPTLDQLTSAIAAAAAAPHRRRRRRR